MGFSTFGVAQPLPHRLAYFHHSPHKLPLPLRCPWQPPVSPFRLCRFSCCEHPRAKASGETLSSQFTSFTQDDVVRSMDVIPAPEPHSFLWLPTIPCAAAQYGFPPFSLHASALGRGGVSRSWRSWAMLWDPSWSGFVWTCLPLPGVHTQEWAG